VKVDPARVEAVAREVAGISDAAAFGHTDANGLTRIALVFVSVEPTDVSALATHMQMRLDESAPSNYARVASIARNHMGKVNRQQIAAQFAPLFDS
jgi:acyl-CoA synthetase (AMP-forming)/AMP-acid ligase II